MVVGCMVLGGSAYGALSRREEVSVNVKFSLTPGDLEGALREFDKSTREAQEREEREMRVRQVFNERSAQRRERISRLQAAKEVNAQRKHDTERRIQENQENLQRSSMVDNSKKEKILSPCVTFLAAGVIFSYLIHYFTSYQG